MTALDDLKDQVDSVLQESLAGFTPRRHRIPKIIRDPVSGFISLAPYELAIVDSPIFQRLRDTHQTALTYLVYPGARHTRFEHCLGVAQQAQRMAESLNRERPDSVSPTQVAQLRLAGLLHDVGHGPFSHLSEDIFGEHFAAPLRAIWQERPAFNKHPIGEILSNLIVTSPTFDRVFGSVLESSGLDIDMSRVAGYFLGDDTTGDERFLGEIISGTFDADKLDYFARDSYYTGIKADIDIARILVSVTTDHRSGDPVRHLAIKRSGVHHLEQIIFNKMMLYSSVYHHHKVRAIECAIRAIFARIWEDPSQITAEKLRFPDLAAGLRVTEGEFWTFAAAEPRLKRQVYALIQQRNLPMRAVALSMPTIDQLQWTDAEAYRFRMLGYDRPEQRRIGSVIHGLLKRSTQESMIFGTWFDFPTPPPIVVDAKKTIVDVADGYVELTTFFPTDEWLGAYSDNKLTAHVFADLEEGARRDVTRASLEFLGSEYNLHAKEVAVVQCYKEDPAQDID